MVYFTVTVVIHRMNGEVKENGLDMSEWSQRSSAVRCFISSSAAASSAAVVDDSEPAAVRTAPHS